MKKNKNVPLPPPDYIPCHAWPEYNLPILFHKTLRPRNIPGNLGIEFRYWPFLYQEYIGDKTPVYIKKKGDRWFIHTSAWQRISHSETPKQWGSPFLNLSPSRYAVAFSRIPETGDYTKPWSNTARYNRRAFHKLLQTGSYSIEEVSWEEFKEAYLKSVIVKKVGKLFIHPINYRMRVAGKANEHIRCFGVRDRANNHLVAGMLVFNSPTFKSSYYYAGFYLEEVRRLPLMVGLVDYWFDTSRKQGITFVQFGNSWLPGNPQSWKGFATFKEKFGVEVVSLPKKLFRVRFHF